MKRLLYAVLAVLFLVSAASQITYTVDVLRLLQGSYPDRPFALGDPWPTVRAASRTAFDAGLYDGDRIVAIEGHAVRGTIDLEASVRAHNPGDRLRVTVVRDGQTFDCQVIVRESQERPSALFAGVAWIFMPWFSILLGFWVAAARPRDFRAWLMLGILLGFSQMTRNPTLTPLGWGAVIGVPSMVLGYASATSWGISMLLFGIYFPQRWSVDRKAPWVKWILMAGPLGIVLLHIADGLARALKY